MAAPTRWFNSFFYALIGALLIWLLSWLTTTILLERSFEFWIKPDFIWKGILITFFIPFLVIFSLLGIAFNSFSKLNISQLYDLVPDLNPQNAAKDFESLSEQISSLTDVKSKEIDLLTERENYRREFLGNVSHELKTPLFSIQGYLLTLIEGGVEDESIRDKYLNRINKSVERLTYIVKDLDMITELESGNLKLEQRPFNILALTREVFDLLEIKAQNNLVTLKIENPIDVPIRVAGDIERIEQVLTNLIVNAVNHSAKDNAIVSVSFQTVNGKIKTTIKDNGVGIKPEHLERIFERFYRIDKSRSRTHGGSGLGLSIVKHILEAHGEKIQVSSTFGEGTEFSFLLNKA
ncbi:sensor histidine kinase [Moheibacter lacus]|uniref:histidine kinase n=1 Tax=Moheibacter lacus TaxID=2745851 RepID=A0A838ZNN6_9FLAO|nr:ATP-binding protein [Moheibacter lacus]MBA5628887.1 ATP-binding protein [Moheibacter lacus]